MIEAGLYGGRDEQQLEGPAPGTPSAHCCLCLPRS